MTVVGFIFLGLITIGVNIFVTAFLIARSHQSKRIMQDIQENAQSIIRQVNRATITHTTIADNTVKDLTVLIAEARRHIDILSKKVEIHNFKSITNIEEYTEDKIQKQTNIKRVSSKESKTKKDAYVFKDNVMVAEKNASKKMRVSKKNVLEKTSNNIKNTKFHKTKSLPKNIEFQKLIKKKLSDEKIASMLELTKAEVTLARFVLQNVKSPSKK